MARLSWSLSSSATATATLAVAICVVALTQCPTVHGYAKYGALLPNGNDIPDAPAIGHPDAEGMQGLNEFGKDWNKLGKKWTKEYCMADSDGDGFTNGQELGDPCCTWTPANPAGLITEGISHPSDKTKTPSNPKLQVKCSTGGGGGTSGAGNSTAPGASNSTAGGTAGGAGKTTDNTQPGKVNAGPSIPEDDDEDDSSESATLKPKTSSGVRSTVNVVVALVSSVAMAHAMW